jgi:hypothetical protein
MVYNQEDLGKNKFRRVFTENVDSEELVWHRDREDREVFVESSNGWMLQMDNELPQVLQEGQKYFIPKETYHRIFKGTGDLKIVIDESVGKIRIPKVVKENIKKGLWYLKKSGKKSNVFESIHKSDSVSLETILEFKKFFDSHSKNVTLNESFKGEPQKDDNYIQWLLRGGNAGYNWVIRETKKRV